MSVIELNDVSVTFHEGGRTVAAWKKARFSASWVFPELANPLWCALSICWNDQQAAM